jgi:exoribonuclease R
MLGEEEVLLRMTKAEAGASAINKADRASRSYWTAVYLADKIQSVWEGIILDNPGSRAVVLIPYLGLETQVHLKRGEPNGKISLTCLSVKIPEGEIIFTEN